MTKTEIIELIESKYIYFNIIEKYFYREWNRLKTDLDEESFFEDLYLFMNYKLDSHTKLIDNRCYNYILPITLTCINEKIVYVGGFGIELDLEKGSSLVKIDNVSLQNYGNFIPEFKRTKTLELLKIIETISNSILYKTISLTFLNSNGQLVDIELEYKKREEILNIENSNNIFNYKNFINFFDYNIVYIKLPILIDSPVLKEIFCYIREISSEYNIILDIRNNLGGRVELSVELTEIFSSKDRTIKLKNREGYNSICINGERNKFKSPVIILINNLTASSLEYIFLNSISDEDGFITLGNCTAGMKDIATVYKLNDNYTLILSTKCYDFENLGMKNDRITPKVEVNFNILDIDKFPDLQLEKAIELINSIN